MDKLIDEKTEKHIREKMKDAKEEFENAKKMAMEKQEEMAEKVREKPIEWVAGAFVAGLIIGALISKK